MRVMGCPQSEWPVLRMRDDAANAQMGSGLRGGAGDTQPMTSVGSRTWAGTNLEFGAASKQRRSRPAHMGCTGNGLDVFQMVSQGMAQREGSNPAHRLPVSPPLDIHDRYRAMTASTNRMTDPLNNATNSSQN